MKRLIPLLLCLALVPQMAQSQCAFGGSQYPGGTIAAPASPGTTTTISTCNYAGEYSVISGMNPSYNYQFDMNVVGSYGTVYDDITLAVVASGPLPLSFTPPSAGNFRVRWFLNGPPTCGTDASCHTTTVANTGFSAPCNNPATGGTAQSSVASACGGVPFSLTLSGATNGTGATYQWQSSPDGSAWTNISGATNASYSTSQNSATYYRCIVTCNSGTPANSASVLVNQQPFQNCYCNSNATSTFDEEILMVGVSTMSNSSTCSTTGGPGSMMSQYSDYTSVVPAPPLARGVTYPLTVEVGTCNGNYNSMVKVWIDFNRNGSFLDAGENVYASTTSTNGPYIVNANFSVPLTADLGVTRMRVVNMETSSAAAVTPCGTYGYGETEDYFVEIFPVPTCPQPTNFVLVSTTTTSADFDWVPGGSETQWQLEYGPPGFTMGSGTNIPITGNSDYSLTGLPSNAFFDAFVRADCGGGDLSFWTQKISFNTFGQGQYMEYDNECHPQGFIDISSSDTSFTLNTDGEYGMSLPFPILFQGQIVSDVTIGNNGAVIFNTTTAQVSSANSSLVASTPKGLYPLWDDLADASGFVYIDTRGVAPNRQFVIQWNKKHDLFATGASNIFQIVLEESNNEIYYQYANTVLGSGTYDNGASATVGVAGPNQNLQLSFNNASFLSANSCVHFYYTDCPNPRNLVLNYLSSDEVSYSWNNGLVITDTFTIIYGPAGFDPSTGGLGTLNQTDSTVIIPGLTQNTAYDIYIYTNCSPTLASFGLYATFNTVPFCSNPYGITVSTGIDSILSAWSWTQNNPLYPVTGYELIYGFNGFDTTQAGIVVPTTIINDTSFVDPNLVAGGAYQMYVRAVCDNYVSTFIGPIPFVMPLTNDSICVPQALNVDGTVYVLHNGGATVGNGESAIAPPATGEQTLDGWGENTLSKTTWFTFVAPPSGQMRISGLDKGFDGQMAVYKVGSCAVWSSFNLKAANDNDVDGPSLAPQFTVCNLVPGDMYYLMHDSRSLTGTGLYSIKLMEISTEAGTPTGSINLCSGDSVNLYTLLGGYDTGGTWHDISNSNRLYRDSMFVAQGIVPTTYNFEYVVMDGCASDEATVSVVVYRQNLAGQNGSLTLCQNAPFNLYEGIQGGLVDMSGTWYDPSMAAMSSGFVSHGVLNTPGVYVYQYFVNNGVCAEDTSYVTVNVDPSCDFLGLQEGEESAWTLMPNPTTGKVLLIASATVSNMTLELRDMNGKLLENISIAEGASSVELDLSNYEDGVYLIQLNQDQHREIHRVVKTR